MIAKLKRNDLTAPAVEPAYKPSRTFHDEIAKAISFAIRMAVLAGLSLLPVSALAGFLEFDFFAGLMLYGLVIVGEYIILHRHAYPAPVLPPAPSLAMPVPARTATTDGAAVAIAKQVQRHSQPQSVSNRLASYVPPVDDEATDRFDDDELAPPSFMAEANAVDANAYVDVVRETVLTMLQKLYAQKDGAFVSIKPDGTLTDGVVVPWSKRGGMTEGQRRQALDLLDQVQRVGGWLIRYDDTLRKWKLNVALYSTFDAACDVLDKCPTRVA